jgi:hypothetical protein
MTFIDTIPENQKTRILANFDALGAEHLAYARGDRDFAVWLYIADRGCRSRTGVSIFDLADFCWRDQYDDDATPKEAVREALAAEGF